MLILEVDRINTYYGKSHILQDVSLKVEQGQIVALLGRNGAGKTTTLRSIMGLTLPEVGPFASRARIFSAANLLRWLARGWALCLKTGGYSQTYPCWTTLPSPPSNQPMDKDAGPLKRFTITFRCSSACGTTRGKT